MTRPDPRPEITGLEPYASGLSVGEATRRSGRPAVKLSSNENPLGPSPLALRAAREALAELHRYPVALADELREALARFHGVKPQQVLVTNGSDELFRLLAETYIRPGDRVVVAHPTFSVYGRAARLMGGRVDQVPVAAYGAMDLPAMAAAAQGGDGVPPARMVFLCRPNNPTGGVFSGEAFARFLEAVPAGCLVVLDEAYKDFDDTSFNGPQWLDRFPALVVVRTFSKVYGLGGLRLGYGLAEEALWKPVLAVRDPFSVNAVAQAAGLAALADREHVARSVRLARAGRRFLTQLAEELGLRVYPSYANFVLIDVGRDAEEVHQALLEHGVIVRPATSFGLPTCIRVTCGLPEENQRFAEALRAVLSVGGAAGSTDP